VAYTSEFVLDAVLEKLSYTSEFVFDAILEKLSYTSEFTFDAVLEPAPLVWVYSYHGATPTGEAVSKVRFKTADDDAEDMSNPVMIPGSGLHYSFWKHVAPVAISPPANFINNVRFYVESPVDWPGCVLRCGLVDNYAQATGVQGVTGDEASTYHPDHPTMNDVNDYTQANPLRLPGSIGQTTGKIIDGYLLLQLEVSPSAQPGVMPEANLVFEYDEA